MEEFVLFSCMPNEAEQIAERVIEKRLAAHVNAVYGVKRTARQQDEVGSEERTMLFIHTRRHLLDQLYQLLDDLSSAQPPAITTVTTAETNREYGELLDELLPLEADAV